MGCGSRMEQGCTWTALVRRDQFQHSHLSLHEGRWWQWRVDNDAQEELSAQRDQLQGNPFGV
eukprot:12412931-Karenia_brevis.AAC.1